VGFLDVAKAFDTVWVKGLLNKLTILNFPSYLVKTLASNLHSRTFQWSFISATSTRRRMRAGVAQGGFVSPLLFSLYVNDIPVPSRHVVYADDTALIATSRSPLLLVSYLETYLNRLELWLRNCRIAINVSKSTAVLFANTTRHIQRPMPVQLFGEPIQMVDTGRYLGVTLNTRLTWSAHVNQVGRKAAQRLGVLGTLHNRKSGISIKNGVLLYKQLNRPIMGYAFPIWRSAAHTHVRKLHVLQSKYLRIATNAPWYVSNRQIHDDLGILFFPDHIRALTESFDSKSADAGNPLVWQLGRHLYQPRAG
jgi:hypothetical protein